MAKLNNFKVEIGIPSIGKVEGTWSPDESEKQAAWELYVELITRVSIVGIDKGLLRESLTSLYSLFEITRKILRNYGANVARPRENSDLSFGLLAVSILNLVLRPFLSKWHPLLLDYENSKPSNLSPIAHEKGWTHYEQFRQELIIIQHTLLEYAQILSEVAEIPSLLHDPNSGEQLIAS